MGNQMSAPYQTVGMCALDTVSPVIAPAPATTTCALMQTLPTPEGATCGFLGYLSRPDMLADWSIESADPNPQTACIKACWEAENCGALSYDHDTRQCALYASSIDSQKPRKSKSGARFYEPDCFYQSCEINEGLEGNGTRSQLDSPLAALTLRHCGLEETVSLTDPKEDYEDHTYFPVSLPFPVQLYGASSDSLYMSINGYIAFTSPFMTHPESHSLPHYTHMAKGKTFDMMPSIEGGLPENSICALWTEQTIVNSLTPSSPTPGYTQQQMSYGSPYGMSSRAMKRDMASSSTEPESLKEQGMRYTVTGEEGVRKVVFTWKTSKKGDAAVVYDYDMQYREDVPGVWMIRYRNVATVGKTATVGSQSTQAAGRYVQYAAEDTPVADGMTLILDSPTNSFRRVRRTHTSKVGKR